MGPMVEFRNTLLHCGLVDMGFSGYPLIWRNGRQGEAFVEERLDRAIATMEWRELFPRTKVSHLLASYSDHDPIMMDMAPPTQPQKRRHKIQRFEEKWVAHANCERIIREAWNQIHPQGSPMYCMFEKSKKCRMDLITWSRVTFGNTRTRLDEKQGELTSLMEAGYGQNIKRIQGVKKEINELLHHEEVFWRQRSRSIWLLVGDKNTKFFHQRATQQWRKNNIVGLYDREEEWHIEEDKIVSIAEDYYKKLFTSSTSLDMEAVLESVDRVVTEGMAQSLTRPYMEEEVKMALFQMHQSKAPGLDVAFEMIHHIRNRRKGKKGHMAVKLDISKAYDRVEWEFLQKIMLKIGLLEQWVNLAMETVHIASYSILINGEAKEFITPSRGIKQGDPLSPYLFLLCTEGLSSLIWRAMENQQLRGVLSCNGGVKISHLLFANDSLLFFEATTVECRNLLHILESYEKASGQAINRQKTKLFFSLNTRQQVKEDIQNMLGA
ncbi:uncharacterized protein LOC112018051 [Quercus suber]|uniref:uncharacterized protein LOC112018051 n=1 Tax=Quercus suber TaxID=58331 RepID=UPI000CE1D097|nr:uncharacterized protein LOC112018051 [Quercus suber]